MFVRPYLVEPREIEEFADFVKEANIAKLSAVGDFYQEAICNLIKQQRVLSYTFSPSLRMLLEALLERVDTDQKIITIYPEIQTIIKNIAAVIHPDVARTERKVTSQETDKKHEQKQPEIAKKEEKGQPKNQELEEDEIFHKYCQEKEVIKINPKNTSFYRNDSNGTKIELSKLVSNSLGQEWSVLLDFYQTNIRERDNEGMKEIRKKLLQNITKTEFRASLTCLGCTEFMFEGWNQKVPGVTKTDVIVLPSILKLKHYLRQIKQAICALANSGGGVILFACKQDDLKIIPQGQLISENAKESILQQMLQIFDFFEPKLVFSQNAHLSFVPVAQNPFCATENSNLKSEPTFKAGIYVTRLRIWNQHRERLFFYWQSEELLTSIRTEVPGKQKFQTKDVQGKLLVKLIKRQFKQYYLSQDCNQHQKLLLIPHLHCFDDHLCPEPHPGCKVSSLKPKNNLQCKQYLLQNKFSYVSMMLTHQVPTSKIISYLVSCKVSQFQFAPLDSPIATKHHIQLLFHDTSPYKLQELLEKFEHSVGRPSLLMVDNAIKLKRKLTFKVLQELYQELKKHSSTQFLKYYEYSTRRSEDSFLEAGSKVSIVYLNLKLREKEIGGSKLIRLEKSNASISLVHSFKSD